MNKHNTSGRKIATRSDQETGTSIASIVTPGRQQHHPSAAKAWVFIVDSSAVGNTIATPTAGASYNISSIGDVGVGQYDVNLSTHFSTSLYGYAASVELDGGNTQYVAGLRGDTGLTSATFPVDITNMTSNLTDPRYVGIVLFGDQ